MKYLAKFNLDDLGEIFIGVVAADYAEAVERCKGIQSRTGHTFISVADAKTVALSFYTPEEATAFLKIIFSQEQSK